MIRSRVADWARVYWTCLSAYAWRAYQEHGRGGVTVAWDLIDGMRLDAEVRAIDPAPLRYWTLAGAEEGEELLHARLIRDYNPATHLVLIVVEIEPTHPGLPYVQGRVFAWSMTGSPAPPQAGARREES